MVRGYKGREAYWIFGPGRIRPKIIIFIVHSEVKWYTGKQIAIATDEEDNNIYTEIAHLVRSGLVERRGGVNHWQYRLNESYPLLKEFKIIYSDERYSEIH